jgi:hypothetical protein
MQHTNRIQNAMINANAGIQGGLVVDSANAHRAYHSFTPCVSSRVTKCPGKRPGSSTKPITRSLERLNLPVDRTGLLTSGPSGDMWRLDSHHDQMPPAGWAMLVLNRVMRG